MQKNDLDMDMIEEKSIIYSENISKIEDPELFKKVHFEDEPSGHGVVSLKTFSLGKKIQNSPTIRMGSDPQRKAELKLIES